MADLKTLISKCKIKDKRAEYELYKACFAMLMGISMRYVTNKDDAVDLLNRAFLKIINSIGSFDESKAFDKWAKTIKTCLVKPSLTRFLQSRFLLI